MEGPRLQPVAIDQLVANVGNEVGISPWRIVTQQMIDMFADSIDDHQFIHVDPERAATTPFGGTIAHGFLTLSLLSAFSYEAMPPLADVEMGVNYGFERVRFVTPVKTGARVRGRFVLADVNVRPSGWVQIATDVTVEIEGSVKPALTARWLTLAVLKREDETA
ncbi:MaoC family dehydratase [Aliihoeflea aestuarii]|jgi:acyl dehydratase|uniref:MaoC family dehydratase n=1 Tax=Aliihoeflea aestuarii TaxID=453840 RepID=UPI0025B44BD0|nr:MaoC family dehydratase [Aliihoeflea aestuarii]